MAATELEVPKLLGLSLLRHNQGLSSSTFTVPPLHNGSLSFSEIQDWHYKNSPDHPLFVYATEDGQTSTITWSSAVMAIHRAARIVCDLVERNPVSSPAKPVIAILMAGNGTLIRAYPHKRLGTRTDILSDTVPYFTLVSGVIRAGYAAFPISTRASADTIACLLTRVGATHIIVSREASLEGLASASLALLVEYGNKQPVRSVAPSFVDLYRPAPNVPFVPLPDIKYEWDDPIVILHSSGIQYTP